MANTRWQVSIIPVDKTLGRFPGPGEQTPGSRRLDWTVAAPDGATAERYAWEARKARYGSRPPKKPSVLVQRASERTEDAIRAARRG
jgi:hypothetical protein